ncbi:MAG: class I SAM-dependent methyltransferase [Clostridia bacterium]|nr:class I SAM-dependent methyltransferase [Clostridia bacterium]
MYQDFAYLYDALQQDVPYEQFAEYYVKIIEKFGGEKGLCLDLGCGTGNMSMLLDSLGFDVIGVDSSVDMLEVAREKATKEERSILFLNQDMTAFELYGTVATVVSTLDCVNYITDEKALLEVFKLVNNYLDPNGLFIFDINSEYKLEHILGDNTYVSDDEDIFYSWQNSYDRKKKICTFDLTFFEKDEDVYYRYDETHYERAYSVEEIKDLLTKAGLEVVGVYDNLSFNAPGEKSERIFFVAKEITKNAECRTQNAE